MRRMPRYAVAGIGNQRPQCFRWIPRLRAELTPSITSTVLLLSLLFSGNNVNAAIEESAYYLNLSVYQQDGLDPLEVWNPGTGYSSFGEAVATIIPTLLQYPNSCIQTRTIRFLNGVSCTLTYTGGNPAVFGFGTNIYRPSTGDVKAVVSYAIIVPLLISCSNGNSGITNDWCGGQIKQKIRDIPNPQCPIAPLQPLPNDPCTQSLEAGRGKDKNGACAVGLTPEMQQEAQCLANKITSLGISYPGPTATLRTPAYQAHLREIWEKWEALKEERNPVCASRKAEIENHKLSHGLTNEPAESSHHETGEAVDVSNEVIRELINRVTTDTSDVQDYINTPHANPPACILRWGGKFRRYDPIHFQLP